MRSTCSISGRRTVFYMKMYYSDHRGRLNFNGHFLPSYSLKPAESQTLADCRLRVATQPQQTRLLRRPAPHWAVCRTMPMLRLEWNPNSEATNTQQNVSTPMKRPLVRPLALPRLLSRRVLHLGDFVQCASTHLMGVSWGTSRKMQNFFEKCKMINIFSVKCCKLVIPWHLTIILS